MKLIPAHCKVGYRYARKVDKGELSKAQAVSELERLGIEPNCALDFIYVLKALLDARGYKRVMGTEATKCLLLGIREDYGEGAFSNAIVGLKSHIRCMGGGLEGHKLLLAECQSLAASPVRRTSAKFPPEVRLLPMSPEESSDVGISEVQQDFFLTDLASRTEGEYRCKTGLIVPEHSVILFQYRGHVVASAELLGVRKFTRPDSNGYTGGLNFAPKSIRVFEPVPPERMRSVWPEFKRFGRDKLRLNPKRYPAFQALLRGIRVPGISADEGLDAGTSAGAPCYTPGNLDTRMVVERQIRERRGQKPFRDALRQRYEGRCAVTGCRILDILEAAHIMPYRGADDNHPENGLLLRADIHTLFDLNLLGIMPGKLRVRLHPKIAPEYKHLDRKKIFCREDRKPSTKAVATRYMDFLRQLRT